MTTKWTSIAGRKRDDWIDFYQTPTWAIEKLLEKETFTKYILEPCSWAWAISQVLERRWYEVLSQDIRRDEWVYWSKWVDFFDCIKMWSVDIITNPPYKYAQEFIEKALKITDWKVVMLLKLSFLESVWRYDFFKSTPLKKVYVFCKRVNMYPEWIEKPKNSWTIAYAWYVWEKWYEWEPIIDWIL